MEVIARIMWVSVFCVGAVGVSSGYVVLVENGQARARIYHAPLAQEPHARNHEDDPDTWTRGSPRIFSRDLSEAEREEMTEDMQERPFRVLPGGIHQYLD